MIAYRYSYLNKRVYSCWEKEDADSFANEFYGTVVNKEGIYLIII